MKKHKIKYDEKIEKCDTEVLIPDYKNGLESLEELHKKVKAATYLKQYKKVCMHMEDFQALSYSFVTGYSSMYISRKFSYSCDKIYRGISNRGHIWWYTFQSGVFTSTSRHQWKNSWGCSPENSAKEKRCCHMPPKPHWGSSYHLWNHVYN